MVLKKSRYVVIVGAIVRCIISIVLSLKFNDILDLLTIVKNFYISVSTVPICSFILGFRIHKNCVCIGIISGVIMTSIYPFIVSSYGQYAFFAVMVVNAIGFFVSHLIWGVFYVLPRECQEAKEEADKTAREEEVGIVYEKKIKINEDIIKTVRSEWCDELVHDNRMREYEVCFRGMEEGLCLAICCSMLGEEIHMNGGDFYRRNMVERIKKKMMEQYGNLDNYIEYKGKPRDYGMRVRFPPIGNNPEKMKLWEKCGESGRWKDPRNRYKDVDFR